MNRNGYLVLESGLWTLQFRFRMALHFNNNKFGYYDHEFVGFVANKKKTVYFSFFHSKLITFLILIVQRTIDDKRAFSNRWWNSPNEEEWTTVANIKVEFPEYSMFILLRTENVNVNIEHTTVFLIYISINLLHSSKW